MTEADLQTRIEELKKLLDLVIRGEPNPVQHLMDDFYSVNFNVPEEMVALSFALHDFDLVEGNRVITIYDDDFPAAAERAGVWPYRSLTTKRKALGALLRQGGISTKPAWFDTLLSAENHNGGIEREKARLQGELAKLDALKV